MNEAVHIRSAPTRRKVKRLGFATLRYLMLGLFAVAIIVPFLFIVTSSLKVNSGNAKNSIHHIPIQWFFAKPQWENYAYVFVKTNILRAFFNTLMYIIPHLLSSLFFSSMAAYSFARLRFPGKRGIFAALMGTMMLPGVLTMIPSYMLMSNFYKWTGTPLPLIIPGMFGGIGVIFFLRQFIINLPVSLEEAAKIDGMSFFGILIKIIIPLCAPAIITQGVLMFNGAYNDYMGPLLYLSNKEHLWTVQLVIASNKFLITQGNLHWPRLLAANVIVILPMFILFFAAQKYLVEGIAVSGMKL